jgi:hypothetical protein
VPSDGRGVSLARIHIVSWVSNLIISTDRADRPVVERLSEWLRAEAPRRERYDAEPQPLGVGYLCSITNPAQNSWGGWKNPECAVWAGALNQADLAALLRYVEGLPWNYAGAVQILIQDQEETYFRLYMFRGGELRQYAPPPPGDANVQHGW